MSSSVQPSTRPASVNPSSRRITRSERIQLETGRKTDGVVCVDCGANVPFSSDHLQLSPCGCLLCCRCALRRHGERGASAMECPCCKDNVDGHHYYSQRSPDTSKISYPEPKSVNDYDPNTARTKQPMAYLYHEQNDTIKSMYSSQEKCSIMVLYCAKFVRETVGDKLKLHSTIHTISHVGNERPTQQYCDELQRFFAFLHPQITTASLTPYVDIPTMNVQEFHNDALTNPTPLLSALFGVATGVEKIDKHGNLSDKKWQDYQAQFLAIAVARDMLLRATVSYPCHLQLMMTDLLSMHKLSKRCKEIFCRLRISASANYSNTAQCREVVECLTKEAEDNKLDTHDLVLVNVDNCGFKEHTDNLNKVGYQQFTAIQTIIIRKNVLEKFDIYSDDPLSRLSREPAHDWTTLCELDKDGVDQGALAKLLVTIKPADIKLLSYSTLEHILIARDEVVREGRFVVGREMVRPMKAIDATTHARLLQNTSIGDMNDSSLDAFLADEDIGNGITVLSQSVVRMSAPVSDTEQDDEAEVNARTRYGDHVTLNSIKSDLALKSTVKAMADYSLAINNIQLEKWLDSDENDGVTEPPIAELGAFIMCDGQPANQLQHLIAEDSHKETPEWNGKVKGFFGAFHTLLKLYNAMGDLFANIFPELVKNFRSTMPRIIFIMNPGDPRQLEKEYPQILSAIYGSAVMHLKAHLGRNPSPKEVDEHMMARAAKFPVCMLVLLYTRFAEVTKLMKASETLNEEGSVELYHTCLRLALPLYAMTHKTDYVRLINDWFVEWHCASPAFKSVYKQFIFVQMSSTGFPMWSDLFMEMSIMDIRRYCGKVYRKGLEKKLEHVVQQIPKKQKTGDVMEVLRTGTQSNKETRSRTHDLVTDVLTKCYDKVHTELQLFHATEPPIVGKDKNGSPVFAEEGDFRLPADEVFNADAADVIALGTERVLRYCQVNNIDEYQKVERSEDDVPLTKIKIKAADRKAELDRAITLSTSTSLGEIKELKPAVYKPEIIKQIETLETTMKVDYGMKLSTFKLSKNKKRDELIGRLIRSRKKLFDKDELAKARLTQEIKDEFKSKYRGLTIEERREILSSGLYSLHPDVLNEDRYCTVEGGDGSDVVDEGG